MLIKKRSVLRCWLCALLMVLSARFHSVAATPGLHIVDKTLVAWVYPANLSQQGGSVLTLERSDASFDAIVLGEIAPGKWMAGSEFFHRTNKQQADWPAETADASTLVQIAIVYQGKQVTIYRNGKIYAAYEMAGEPLVFGEDTAAVFGLRHLDADNGHFAGAIDDARIYDRPLNSQTIAALKPNVMGDIKPLAWWSFEKDGQDQMNTFSGSYLVGAATVHSGSLRLAGPGSLMLAGHEFPMVKLTDRKPGDAFERNRAFRERHLLERYRPGYHFVIPEGFGTPFDPNGAIFWKGRYHLFYIFQDHRGHNWGHASSIDLVHWRHHPTGLTTGMFSGNCFINKQGRPTMCYHQVHQGNALAVALDDQLNNWQKLPTNPITPKTKEGDPHHGKYSSWDPFGWLEGDTYYAIFGGKRPGLVKSPTTGGPWRYVGDFLANTVQGVSINEDVSCADFFKFGDRYMLLCISHRLGCRYYLGQWKNEQFHPELHEKMSWVDNSFFAPESLLDDKGRRIMWAWIFDSPNFGTRKDLGWTGTLSLPRVLWPADDGSLRMNVPKEMELLRYNPQVMEDISLPADSQQVVQGVTGNSIELMIEMSAAKASQYGVKVCVSPDNAEETLVYYDATEKKLKVDTTKSGLENSPKTIEAGPFELKHNEPLILRVFVDKSVVEVFANDRQAVMRRIYPSKADSIGVALFTKGGPAKVKQLRAWDIMPSNPY